MLHSTFKIEALDKPNNIKFRISSDYHFLLFPENEEEWPYYASKNTIKQLTKD